VERVIANLEIQVRHTRHTLGPGAHRTVRLRDEGLREGSGYGVNSSAADIPTLIMRRTHPLTLLFVAGHVP
jgi:hypothetical protein